MSRRKRCVFCNGSGKLSVPADGSCPVCNGAKTISFEYGREKPDTVTCPGCRGDGKCLEKEIECANCYGTGKEQTFPV